MVVRERENFRNQMVPVPEWEVRLQEDFPFMEQDPENGEKGIYQQYGFQCGAGWYQLIKECCEAIAARYAEDGIGLKDIDFFPAQIKEKFGTLRFYYSYTDGPCGTTAFDKLANGESLSLNPATEAEDDTGTKRRKDIRAIVSAAEKKSAYTCENCGAYDESGENVKRRRGDWIHTYCEKCEEERAAKLAERCKRREDI